MVFINWEFRPAVLLDDGRAFAILARGSSWSEVDRVEVVDSGVVMSPGAFAARYPEADPSNIPPQSSDRETDTPG